MARPFEDIRNEMIQLYTQGDYRKVLDILERESPHYPDEAWDTYYFRLCMAALLDDSTKALGYLKEALGQGYWYPVNMLREDTDLKSLQGLPEYEQLIGRSRQRGEEEQARAVPTRLTLKPERLETPPPLLIALHGNGRNAENTAPYWRPATENGCAVVLPQSSQVGGHEAFVWNDRAWGIREVRRHAAEAASELNADPARMFIGGFSMGGGLAVWMALTGEVDVQGFISVGPYLADIGELRRTLAERKPPRLRGYIVIGDADNHCYEVSQGIATLMKEHGLECEVEVHPGMGHVYPENFDESLRKATRFILGG